MIILDEDIREAIFVNRPNRFQAYVILDEKEIMVHVPNTGRCKEILIPGSRVILRVGKTPNRKTPYDLIAVYKGDKLINIDSQIPNKVVEEALKNGKIEGLKKYDEIKRECKYGNSRFDFRLNNAEEEYYLEVKGVTLEENGHCRFPDAPTERGTKHLLELVELKKSGKGAGVIFLIQMSGMKSFSPNNETDIKFSEALRYAKSEGVDVFAYECVVDKNIIELNKKVIVNI